LARLSRRDAVIYGSIAWVGDGGQAHRDGGGDWNTVRARPMIIRRAWAARGWYRRTAQVT